MGRRVREPFLEPLRPAAIGVGNDKTIFVKTRLGSDTEDRAMVGLMDRPRKRCPKRRGRASGAGQTSEKVSATIPTTAGTCVTLDTQRGRILPRRKIRKQVSP